jgi:uncharacterized protein YukE
MASDAKVGQVGELRQFGKNLSTASNALSTLFSQLGAQMNRVLSTWDDKKTQQFMSEFTQGRAQVDKLSQSMMEFSRDIEEKCRILDEYMSH